MNFQVKVAPAPQKFLARLRDESLKRRLVDALHVLESNPHPIGSKKLQGESELYRVRVGDYRIIYQVRDALLLVLVVQIGHRREIYC